MNPESFIGKTALITGASKRIGRAIAIALAGEGVNIIIHYNSSDDKAEELRDELVALGVKAWTVGADFEKQSEYESLIKRATGKADNIDSIDVLINNASIFPAGGLSTLEFTDLISTIRINAWVPFELSRQFALNTKQGNIINILDTRVDDFDWGHVAYILSKKLLYELTRMMTVEFGPDITVNAIAPGLILPPPGRDDAYLDSLAGNLPLKKHGGPEDISEALVFLLKSDYITGQVIHVDGGRHVMERNYGPDTY